MGLNTMGLGIILSMRDMASVPATRAAGALGQLDRAAQDFSMSFNAAIATALEGMNLLSSGLLLAAAPAKFVQSTFETQKAMSGLAAVGVEELDMMKQAAVDFTNTWAGATQYDYLKTANEIKEGIITLSDEAVAFFTTATGITARATKSTIKDLEELMPIMYGILRDTMPEADDISFINALSGALPEAIKIYRTSGKYMGDAFSQASSLATAMGVNMQEQMAIIGQLQQTMTGSEAGTKFRAFVRSIARANDIQAKLGLDIQFDDAEGMLLPLMDILESLRDRFGETLTVENTELLRKLFGSREAVATITNLLPYIDQLKGDTDLLAMAMEKGLDHAIEIATIASDNIGDSWVRLTQVADNLSQTIGEALNPVYRPMIEIASSIMIGLQNLIKTNPMIIRLIGAFATFGGGLLAFTGIIFILSGAMQMINGSFILMKARLTMLRAEFSKFALMVWPIIVLAGLLYLAFKSNFLGIGDFAENAMAKIKSFFNSVSQVWNGLRELFSNFDGRSGMISEELYNMLNEAGLWDITKSLFMLGVRLYYLWEGIKEGFKLFMDYMVIIFTPLWNLIDTLIIQPIGRLLDWLGSKFPSLGFLISPTEENVNMWQKIGQVIGFTIGNLLLIYLPLKLWGKVWGVIKLIGGAFKGLFGFIKPVIGVLWKAFAAVGTFVAGILGLPAWVGMVIVAAVAAIIFLIIKYWDTLSVYFKRFGDIVIGVFEIIGAVIGGVILGAMQIVASFVGSIIMAFMIIGASIIGIILGVLGVIIGVAASIVAVFQTAIFIVGAIFFSLIEVIWGIVQSIVAIVKAVLTGNFEELGETLYGIWSGIWDRIGGYVDTAITGIKEAWGTVVEWFGGIWDSLEEGAGKFFDWIKDKFSWVFDGISGIKEGFSIVGDGISSGVNKIFGNNEIRRGAGREEFATGGIFTGRSDITVGEQPGVSEAVVPLSGNYMKPFASEIASLMSNMMSFNYVEPELALEVAGTGSTKPYNGSTINNVNNYNREESPTEIVNNNNTIGNSEGSGSNKTVIEVPVYLEGREISRVVANYLDRERRR